MWHDVTLAFSEEIKNVLATLIARTEEGASFIILTPISFFF